MVAAGMVILWLSQRRPKTVISWMLEAEVMKIVVATVSVVATILSHLIVVGEGRI